MERQNFGRHFHVWIADLEVALEALGLTFDAFRKFLNHNITLQFVMASFKTLLYYHFWKILSLCLPTGFGSSLKFSPQNTVIPPSFITLFKTCSHESVKNYWSFTTIERFDTGIKWLARCSRLGFRPLQTGQVRIDDELEKNLKPFNDHENSLIICNAKYLFSIGWKMPFVSY